MALEELSVLTSLVVNVYTLQLLVVRRAPEKRRFENFPMNYTVIGLNRSGSFLSSDSHRSIARIRTPLSDLRLQFPGRVAVGRREKRCRLTAATGSLELPLLPFNTNEVLVPSESKTLHLYEARYLALLDESLQRKKNLFVHFVLDPISISETATEASFAAKYGCLVHIETVERLEVGALVSIRGIGRVKIFKFLSADPYLVGEIRPVSDVILESRDEVGSKISLVKESIRSLNSLEIKLKAPKDAPLQTHIFNSVTWAETEPSIECDQSFIPSRTERMSFAAFQPVSGSTQSELSRLQQEKLRAMEMKDTMQRLDCSMKLINGYISMVAAKLAIQSLDVQ